MASEIQATTVRATNLKANDGTASLTVANSSGAITASGGIAVDTISEKTSTNGVTIDGVNIKDSAINTDNYFLVEMDANQTLSNNTWTSIEFDTAVYDPNSWLVANYKFKPNIAGKYFVYLILSNFLAASDVHLQFCSVLKNTETSSATDAILYGGVDNRGHASQGSVITTTGIATMNGSSDYLTAHMTSYTTGSSSTIYADNSRFGAFRIGA